MTVIIETPPDFSSSYRLVKKFLKLEEKDFSQELAKSDSIISGVAMNQTLSSIKQGGVGKIIAEFAE
jgi:hypothetical protein